MKDENDKQSYRTIIIVFIITTLIVIGLYIWNFHETPLSKFTSDWGSFGDYLSGTLFTPITVFLVWLTYTSQSKELKEQREINKLNLSIISQQSFEQTFFTWLKSIQELTTTEKMDLAVKDYISEMRKRVNDYSKRFQSCIKRSSDGHEDLGDQGTSFNLINKEPKAIFINIKRNKHKWLETYINALIEFLKYIDSATKYPETDEQKRLYISILLSHLSDSDVFMLAASAFADENKTILTLLQESSVFDRM